MKDKSMQHGGKPIIFLSNPKCYFGCAGASEGGCGVVIDSIEHSELNVRVKCSELNVHIQHSELNVFILVCN